MVKISRTEKKFDRLGTRKLAEASILERYDLQEYIANSLPAFCEEIDQKLMIIDKEVRPSDTVEDRIDLLALDETGTVVVIELKRGSDKLQLLQAIGYAAMISKWEPNDLAQHRGKDRTDAIADFIEPSENEGIEGINKNQRVLLVAEEYDYEVLATAEWLYEKYDVDIGCIRVSLAVDGASEFLAFAQVFPNPELAEQARKRGSRGTSSIAPARNWRDSLSTVANPAVKTFFEAQLAAGRDNNPRYRQLLFSAGRECRFSVQMRNKYARVTQLARFAGDIDFWKSQLSNPDSINERTEHDQDDRLGFRLVTPEDFGGFERALNSELELVQWGSAEASQAASA